MGIITIDHKQCRKDGLCMAVCPMDLIQEDSRGFPEMGVEAEATCLRCGHCQAICPHGALTIVDGFPAEQGLVDTTQTMNWEAIEKLVKSRRSIRRYRNDQVPHATLDRLLDMVRWAPTARNGQPVYWTVVKDKQKVQRLASMVVDWLRGKNVYPGLVTAWDKDRDLILRDAPHLVIAHASAQAISPAIDCAIAVTTLELAASAVGIGACWAGIFMAAANDYPPLVEMLQLPKGHNVYGALMMGYPQIRYKSIPRRREAEIRWL